MPLSPTLNTADRKYLDLAIEQAQLGWDEGGVPIGAALVHHGPDGDKVLAVGRNRRVQMGSVIRHGETDCLERAGRLPASVYRECTLYTTLSPCTMCAGTAILYEIPRIVIGENRSFEASESWLESKGTELVIADDAACIALMDRMMSERPEVWAEDIGVEASELSVEASELGA
ncbi:nucleoside deaminase [Leucobacter viscericola]|uniref:Nucleoside deaminase n=1 Tax=Leucobacter viscericola TaxID=2714935 RepID=A0A6G7XFL4_9MICO|nr:nucleoside deaminase [Leucobacter viscericola]QIK63161.1 nucleoside deaminase [Leucobacter viscericola]